MPRPRIKRAVPRLLREARGVSAIELLVVLIIIGILAAISIAAFANEHNKANDVDAKTHARSAQIAMESYYVEKRTYAGVTKADLEEQQTSLKDANGLAISTATGNEFELQTTSTSIEPVTYKVHRLPTGTIQRTCAPQDTGACKGDGVW